MNVKSESPPDANFGRMILPKSARSLIDTGSVNISNRSHSCQRSHRQVIAIPSLISSTQHIWSLPSECLLLLQRFSQCLLSLPTLAFLFVVFVSSICLVESHWQENIVPRRRIHLSEFSLFTFSFDCINRLVNDNCFLRFVSIPCLIWSGLPLENLCIHEHRRSERLHHVQELD